MPQYDVFISYDSANQVEASSLKAALEFNGYSCWMDTQRIFGGDQIPETISQGIQSCRFLCAVVTAAYAKSYYGRTEANMMGQREGLFAPVRVIPCLFDSSAPTFIGERAFIKFFQRDFHVAFRELLTSLQAHREKMNQRVDTAKLVGAGVAGMAALIAALTLSDSEPEQSHGAAVSRDGDDYDFAATLLAKARMDRLRGVARSRLPGIPMPSRKADLAALIANNCGLSVSIIDEAFTVIQLRELCYALELETFGTKSDLAKRLLRRVQTVESRP